MATGGDILYYPVSLITREAERQAQQSFERIKKIYSSPLKLGGGGGIGGNGANSIQAMTGHFDQMSKSIESVNSRIVAFSASFAVLGIIERGLSGVVKSTIEVGEAIAQIQVILNTSSSELTKFQGDLFKVANATGQSFGEAAKAAGEFARQGLTLRDTLEATKQALIFSRTSGLDAAKATEILTATTNAFINSGVTYAEVVNKMNAVDAAFAISSAQLGDGLSRVASIANDTGVSLDQLNAIIASTNQITQRGGAITANGLKTIFANLQSERVTKALREYGVATRDANGDARNSVVVLQDLAGVYGNLNGVQKSALDQMIAGKYQLNTFKATIQSLTGETNNYTRAVKISENASNEATKKNEILNQTLASVLNKTKNQLVEGAANIGEKVFTKPIQNISRVVDFVSGGEEEAGTKQGTGFAKYFTESAVGGISNFLAGPGLAILAATFAKIALKLGADFTKAFATINSITKATGERAIVERGIVTLLNEGDKDLVRQLSTTTSLVEKQRLLNQLVSQTAINREKDLATLAQYGSLLSAQNAQILRGKVTGQPIRAKAEGYIPNAANGMLAALYRENQSISAGVGGASPNAKAVVKTLNIGRGNEKVVVNSDEWIVKNFNGGKYDAVFNKDMIKAIGGAQNLTNYGQPVKALARGTRNLADSNISPLTNLNTVFKSLEQTLKKFEKTTKTADDSLRAKPGGRASNDIKAQRDALIANIQSGKNIANSKELLSLQEKVLDQTKSFKHQGLAANALKEVLKVAQKQIVATLPTPNLNINKDTPNLSSNKLIPRPPNLKLIPRPSFSLEKDRQAVPLPTIARPAPIIPRVIPLPTVARPLPVVMVEKSIPRPPYKLPSEQASRAIPIPTVARPVPVTVVEKSIPRPPYSIGASPPVAPRPPNLRIIPKPAYDLNNKPAFVPPFSTPIPLKPAQILPVFKGLEQLIKKDVALTGSTKGQSAAKIENYLRDITNKAIDRDVKQGKIAQPLVRNRSNDIYRQYEEKIGQRLNNILDTKIVRKGENDLRNETAAKDKFFKQTSSSGFVNVINGIPSAFNKLASVIGGDKFASKIFNKLPEFAKKGLSNNYSDIQRATSLGLSTKTLDDKAAVKRLGDDARAQKAQAITQKAFVVSFLAPMAASFVAEAFKRNGEATSGSRITEGIGGAVGTGAVAAAFIPKFGLAIGTMIGLFGSLNAVLKETDGSLEDVQNSAKKEIDSKNLLSQTTEQYNVALQNLKNLQEAGAPEEKIRGARRALTNAETSISDLSIKKALVNADSAKDRETILSDIAGNKIRGEARIDGTVALQNAIEKTASGFGGFFQLLSENFGNPLGKRTLAEQDANTLTKAGLNSIDFEAITQEGKEAFARLNPFEADGSRKSLDAFSNEMLVALKTGNNSPKAQEEFEKTIAYFRKTTETFGEGVGKITKDLPEQIKETLENRGVTENKIKEFALSKQTGDSFKQIFDFALADFQLSDFRKTTESGVKRASVESFYQNNEGSFSEQQKANYVYNNEVIKLDEDRNKELQQIKTNLLSNLNDLATKKASSAEGRAKITDISSALSSGNIDVVKAIKELQTLQSDNSGDGSNTDILPAEDFAKLLYLSSEQLRTLKESAITHEGQRQILANQLKATKENIYKNAVRSGFGNGDPNSTGNATKTALELLFEKNRREPQKSGLTSEAKRRDDSVRQAEDMKFAQKQLDNLEALKKADPNRYTITEETSSGDVQKIRQRAQDDRALAKKSYETIAKQNVRSDMEKLFDSLANELGRNKKTQTNSRFKELSGSGQALEIGRNTQDFDLVKKQLTTLLSRASARQFEINPNVDAELISKANKEAGAVPAEVQAQQAVIQSLQELNEQIQKSEVDIDRFATQGIDDLIPDPEKLYAKLIRAQDDFAATIQTQSKELQMYGQSSNPLQNPDTLKKTIDLQKVYSGLESEGTEAKKEKGLADSALEEIKTQFKNFNAIPKGKDLEELRRKMTAEPLGRSVEQRDNDNYILTKFLDDKLTKNQILDDKRALLEASAAQATITGGQPVDVQKLFSEFSERMNKLALPEAYDADKIKTLAAKDIDISSETDIGKQLEMLLRKGNFRAETATSRSQLIEDKKAKTASLIDYAKNGNNFSGIKPALDLYLNDEILKFKIDKQLDIIGKNFADGAKGLFVAKMPDVRTLGPKGKNDNELNPYNEPIAKNLPRQKTANDLKKESDEEKAKNGIIETKNSIVVEVNFSQLEKENNEKLAALLPEISTNVKSMVERIFNANMPRPIKMPLGL